MERQGTADAAAYVGPVVRVTAGSWDYERGVSLVTAVAGGSDSQRTAEWDTY